MSFEETYGLDFYEPYETSEYDDYWIDRYGKEHNILDMDIQYVQNCIKFCKKKRWVVPSLMISREHFLIKEMSKKVGGW